MDGSHILINLWLFTLGLMIIYNDISLIGICGKITGRWCVFITYFDMVPLLLIILIFNVMARQHLQFWKYLINFSSRNTRWCPAPGHTTTRSCILYWLYVQYSVHCALYSDGDCVHCTVHGIVRPPLRALTSPQEFLLKTRNIASPVSHLVIARQTM